MGRTLVLSVGVEFLLYRPLTSNYAQQLYYGCTAIDYTKRDLQGTKLVIISTRHVRLSSYVI